MRIPQSPDLVARQRLAILLVAVAVIVILGLCIAILGGDKASKLARLHAMPAPHDTTDRSAEAAELHEALLAVHSYVSRQVDPEKAESVRWTNTRHEGHNGYFVIEGHAEFQYSDNTAQILFYRVTTVRKKGVWEITEKFFTPLPSNR